MIDTAHIGKTSPPLTVDVEAGQLRFFAKATGETDPVYFDEDAARAAGYPALPAPPTFLFSLNLAQPDPFARFVELGIDLLRVLHGEQQFEYLVPILAGDRITLVSRIADIYAKKGGALEFVVEEMTGTNQHGHVVGKAVQTLVVRNG